MEKDEILMQRCLQLAANGLGMTYPNPMVGCVIVHQNRIIAEAWHQKAGEGHAEFHAIHQVKDKALLKEATLYVSLEPCAHHGKTPPCADLIIEHQIPRVVIATADPFSKVNGLGIRKLKEAGIAVTINVLEKEAQFLNRRFINFHQSQRPYIILKWAQTKDEKMATTSGEQKWITNAYSKQLVHKWRTEEQGILVGTHTAQFDNPQLNARLWNGKQPIRMVLDRELKLREDLHLFDGSQRTLVFTEIEKENRTNLEYIKINFDENIIQSILHEMYALNVQSLIVEGGKRLLESFIQAELWDEARILTANESWGNGVSAPKINGDLHQQFSLDNDHLSIYIQ